MTSDGVSPRKSEMESGPELKAAAAAMVAGARRHGLALTGPNGLLKFLTKHVLERR